MADRDDAAGAPSSGVDALIERLRDQGVMAGRAEARRVVAEAERRADWIVEQAREEAERIREQARTEATRLERSGKEALEVAARDAVLELRDLLGRRFAGEIRRMVGRELRDEAFLQRLILELAGRAREAAGVGEAERVEVVLPERIVGLDELRRRPEALREGSLSHFVVAVAERVLREGVTLKPDTARSSGVCVRLAEGAIEVELSDEAVAEILLQHLQPRFRALLEGIVK